MRRWFQNLKVAQKLMLISVFFVLPDSVMFCFFITGINSNIDFAQMEQKGNAYQRPLEELLELIPQHRRLDKMAKASGQGTSEDLAAKTAQIDAAFTDLERVDARIGPDLQFTDAGLAKRKREHYRVQTVKKEWQEFTAQLPTMEVSAAAERYVHLVSDIRTMITHAGDLSNLILDPDLDSYYTMDATLLALPETQDRLATIMGYGETAIEQPAGLTIENRQQLTVYATLLKESDMDRIGSSLQTALNEDPNFYGPSDSFQARIPAALRDYEQAADAFVKLTIRVAGSEAVAVTPGAYDAAGLAARAASFKLWHVADDELDILLERRIEAFRHKRTLSLLVAGCALLAAISFVTFITKSISGPLKQQAADLQGANAALEAQIAERKRAEVELRHSEAQLAAAQKVAQIGSWELELPGHKLSWSDENYRIHGFKPHGLETSYEASLELVHPDDRSTVDTRFKQALEEKSPFSFEHRIIRQDGQERVLQQRGDFVLGKDGQVEQMFGTAQDITERRQAEQQLEKAHNDLLDVSRRAGMAEVATGVLHNVGNVLNSVNVSASLITERVGKSRASHLGNVSTLLKDNAHDLGGFFNQSPKGKLLPAFIETLAERLTVEQTEILRELEGLSKNIAHIKEIVAVQQNYARVAGLTETLSAVSLVEDALRMNDAAFDRHGVTITREFTPVPLVCVDKHKVLQILVNVIRNAKYAVSEAARLDKQIKVRISINGSGRVKIAVVDNGIGIAKENLTRIFSHGFTTKRKGHGFGLHSSALAADELGGSLSAQSEGPAQGATFILELPVAPAATG